MNLKNQKVTHERFGDGIIVDYTDDRIVIDFPSGEKKFVYPDVFGQFLTLNNKKVSADMDKVLEKSRKEQKEVEIEQNKIRIIEHEKHQMQLKRRKILKTTKIHPSSQVVFRIRPEEQENVFTDWRVFTGAQVSGERKGLPKRPARLTPNSACLLTTNDLDAPEEERYIIGAFMVRENFVGKLCNDGYIVSHPDYRFRLSDEASKNLLFWNYYYNNRYKKNITWNSGLYRYFDNIIMAQILKDILSMEKDPKEKKKVSDFFEYFCNINNISRESIGEPKGALKRS